MKRLFKRLVSTMLVIALCGTMFGSLTANAQILTYDNSTPNIVVYLPIKPVFKSDQIYLYLSGSRAKKIEPSSIKISDTSVAKINNVKDFEISVKIKGAGKTTVRFTCGKKTYKFKITVKEHADPLKTLKISGVKNNQNIVGSTSRHSNGLFILQLKKTTKKATITVKPKSGWAVEFVHVADNTKSPFWRIVEEEFDTPFTDTRTFAMLDTLDKSLSYTVSVGCVNLKTGAKEVEYYVLNRNDSYFLSTQENQVMRYTP